MPVQTTTHLLEAESLCRERGIEILQSNKRIKTGPCSPQQTHSVVKIQKMIERHGADHAWAVLYALSEVENKPIYLSGSLIGAVSDLLLRFPNWEQRLGDLIDAFDRLDMPELQGMAKQGPGIDKSPPKQRILIAAYLHVLLMPIMEPTKQGVMM